MMEGQYFVLTGINNYSDIDLSSLHAMLLQKPPFMDLQNALFSIMACHTSLLLIKDITSQQRKCSSGFMFMKFIDHVPQHPEANGLIQWWNGLLKTQLQC